MLKKKQQTQKAFIFRWAFSISKTALILTTVVPSSRLSSQLRGCISWHSLGTITKRLINNIRHVSLHGNTTIKALSTDLQIKVILVKSDTSAKCMILLVNLEHLNRFAVHITAINRNRHF